MSSKKDLSYWEDRINNHGSEGLGFGCNKNYTNLDNDLRLRSINKLISINPGMKVLDIGTGDGYWAIECAKKGAEVVGVDFNEKALEYASNEAERLGLRIDWKCINIENISLSNKFDLIFSITCLQHITSHKRQNRAIRKLIQLLNPGGKLIILEDTPKRSPLVTHYMRTYSQEDWIDLLKLHGVKLIDYKGVSFLRYRIKWLPAGFSAKLDLVLGYIKLFRSFAKVSVFSFSHN